MPTFTDVVHAYACATGTLNKYTAQRGRLARVQEYLQAKYRPLVMCVCMCAPYLCGTKRRYNAGADKFSGGANGPLPPGH